MVVAGIFLVLVGALIAKMIIDVQKFKKKNEKTD
jgi:hypothetical protein